MDWSRGRLLVQYVYRYPVAVGTTPWVAVQIRRSDWPLLHRQFVAAQKAPPGSIRWPFRPNPSAPVVAYTLQWGLEMPYWMICLPLVGFPEALRYRRGNARVVRRRLHGLCARCGYDLRASAERCPECGTARNDPVSDRFAMGIRMLLRVAALLVALFILLVEETFALTRLFKAVPVSVSHEVLIPAAFAALLAWYAARGTVRLRLSRRVNADN